MHPQLAALVSQLEAATAHARQLVAALDDAMFHARPPRGGWSAAECIAHLNLTTAAVLPGIDVAVATGRPGFADSRPYRCGLLGSLLAWSLEPPVRLRFRTAPAFVPKSTGPKGVILADFERLQRDLASRIQSASGLNQTTFGSPQSSTHGSRITFMQPFASWRHMNGAICGKQSERYGRSRRGVAPNKRLKLAGADRSRGGGVLCPRNKGSWLRRSQSLER